MIGVYTIELNGKRYVGSSVNIERRWNQHNYDLKKGTHSNQHLQRAVNKYGQGNLVYSVIETIEKPEDLLKAEQKYIDTLEPEYNILPTAGSQLGIKRSDETKEKIRKANLGRVLSEETRKKISDSLLGHKRRVGKKHSDEARKKMRESHLGKNVGHIVTEETRGKIRVSNLGKIVTEETRRKIGDIHRGKVMSEESKAKISEAMSGRFVSEETRQKLREANLGKRVSSTARKNMSEAAKKRKRTEQSIKNRR